MPKYKVSFTRVALSYFEAEVEVDGGEQRLHDVAVQRARVTIAQDRQAHQLGAMHFTMIPTDVRKL